METKIYARNMIDGVQYTDGIVIIRVQFYKFHKDNSPIYKIYPVNFPFIPIKHPFVKNYRLYNYYQYNGYFVTTKPIEKIFNLFYEQSVVLQTKKQTGLTLEEKENLENCFTPIESWRY